MRSRVVDVQVVSHLNLREPAVDREFVIILAQGSGHIVNLVSGRILLAEHGDMVVSAVHGRAHQVRRAGVHADVLLVDVLLVDRLRDQAAVRSHHEPSHFGENAHVSHSMRHQDLIVHPVHSCPDLRDVSPIVLRTVGNADAP